MALKHFRAKFRADKIRHHYNPLLHGETVRYIPVPNGAEFDTSFDQSFVMLDDDCRKINVHIVDVGSLEIENVDTETKVERIEVKALKDCARGIDRPNLGDRIIRSAPWDVDERPYYFTGDDQNQGPDDWRLTFERKRRQAQGVS